MDLETRLVKLKQKLNKWEEAFLNKKQRKPTIQDIKKIPQVGKKNLTFRRNISRIFCSQKTIKFN